MDGLEPEDRPDLTFRMDSIIQYVDERDEVWYTNLCNSFGSFFSKSGQAYRQALWKCLSEKKLILGADRKVRVNKG